MQLGKLRGIIAEKNIKTRDLAKALNISTQAVGKKISGKTKITVDDAIVFCDVIGITDNHKKCEIFLTTVSQ